VWEQANAGSDGTGAKGHFLVTDVTFASLGLAEPILKALAAEGYHQPTPIQARSIPLLLEGKDLLGIAQTGTGKTAAFALPILQALSARREAPLPKSPRVLVLAPTRELALQIWQSFETYGRNLRLTSTVVFGGVGHGNQIKTLRNGVDVLVATPGRLLDLAGEGHLRLHRATHVVLDEADRMFDMGFIRDVRKIVEMLPKVRQTLLFSATMPPEIRSLANAILKDPVRVEIAAKQVTVDRVEQYVYFVEQNDKRALLAKLLADEALSRVIIFTRTKHRANRVADQLDAAGMRTAAIHGNKSQNARQRALEDFRNGKARILVATDIAARGIDVDGVTHVINFELPNEPESYVHRIGRTARAGSAGIAWSFCARDERPFLRDIERLTRKPLTVAEIGPLPKVEAPKGEGRHEAGPQRQGNGNGHGKSHGHGSGQGHGQGKPGGARRKKPRRFEPRRAAA
jgi:ATP-dependent RNA helicase RhlE